MDTNYYSSIIHKSQKMEATQMFISCKWINKMWNIHTVGYYSAIKKIKVLIDSLTWINLENTVLSERSQHKMSRINNPYRLKLY